MIPKPPTGARAAGRRLWSAVLGDYELAEHEQQILREAVRTVDLIATLHAVATSDGPMQDSPQGRRVHPAVVELRQQRVVLARLLAALNIPTESDGPSVRAPRGVYRIRGAS
ncbi:hypothetical protein Rruber_01218 [Rhodococcus ruber]|uniref:hypothetical protein n=1 Tax=Rhodococcus ruber TaxID=1830 RepID=UPI00315DF67C